MLTYWRNLVCCSVDVVFLRPNVKNMMNIIVKLEKNMKKNLSNKLFLNYESYFGFSWNFWVRFVSFFIVSKISTIDRHNSVHQKKASWWIVCVKYLQKFQILIITQGQKYWILNWFWSSPKQCPHKKGSTDKRGKLNCFVFEVRWCLLYKHTTCNSSGL